MKTKKSRDKKAFKKAVEKTPDVATCFKTGLTALGAYSSKVTVTDTRHLQGSIDIDACTTASYPNANRWDYAFAYKGEVFFIEVHGADSSEVSTVKKKLQWLKNWLQQQAPEIDKLKAKKLPPFYWVQSKDFAIPKTSRQYRAAKAAGLIPIPKLKL